jgi:superfamily II DNA or RNA helicase
VGTVAGDYHGGELETAMRAPHVVGDVVESWRKHAEGRRTVVFAVGVEHSRDLAERFELAGARVAHLDGSTPEDERAAILLGLELGRLDVVCNVDVLTEGWDQPKVKCAIMARPTKSLTKWMQCAGRILRPWGDQAPLILDHSGNVDRHGLPHEDREWSLDGQAKRKPNGKLRVCPGCYGYVETSPCPLCGHSFAMAMVPRSLRTADGVMERVGAREVSVDPKRAQYDALVDEARRKGFKPGYASAKWKEKNGNVWPSWAWSQSTKADFARDAEWQARVSKRTKEREFWTAQSAAGESMNDNAAPDETETYVDEVEGAFDGLV